MQIICKKCQAIHIIKKFNICNNINSDYMMLGKIYINMCIECGYIFRISIPSYIPLEQVIKYIVRKYDTAKRVDENRLLKM